MSITTIRRTLTGLRSGFAGHLRRRDLFITSTRNLPTTF